jgi:PP-loop superfamily ATP-utilizing enzyme
MSLNKMLKKKFAIIIAMSGAFDVNKLVITAHFVLKNTSASIAYQ